MCESNVVKCLCINKELEVASAIVARNIYIHEMCCFLYDTVLLFMQDCRIVPSIVSQSRCSFTPRDVWWHKDVLYLPLTTFSNKTHFHAHML